MTIIQGIQEWSMEQPGWQQDAISRLFFERELSNDDLNDLFALLKAEHGIPDPQGRVAGALSADAIAVPPESGHQIRINAIKDLRGVNAIAEGQRIAFSPNGLTVVYGGNGTGKSGYSRVLKKVCRARDQAEPILPDASLKPGTAPPASASFELEVDGRQIEHTWIDGNTPHEDLSSIAIFDSRCARAYLDNQGDFAYSPYGLDILEGLVKACGKLKEKAIEEIRLNRPNLEPFAALCKTETKVGKLLSMLSGETDIGAVESLAALSGDDRKRLETLAKTLNEADPKQKAQALSLQAARFENLSGRTSNAIGLIEADKASELQQLIDELNAAKEAARLAAEHFVEGTHLLSGTGGDAWKTLFEAARSFAAESHPDSKFPNLGSTALCPLCQNPLGDEGGGRLNRFDKFVQMEAESTAKTAREEAAKAYVLIDKGDLDLRIDETLRAELDSWNPDVAKLCSEMQDGLIKRQQEIRRAAAGEITWDEVPPVPEDVRGQLLEGAAGLKENAKTLVESSREEERTALISEHAELDARHRLAELQSAVLDTIGKLDLTAKLKSCVGATVTTGISRKSTQLARSMATPEVAAALNQELVALGVDDLQVVMKNVSPGGRTQFKLALELPGGVKPAQILSEGEQRAIALASFLAEINLNPHSGGVVFDDPVCSLDHRRRWKVARRLAVEATKRQVIVLTHDIYFLRILQAEVEKKKVDLVAQSVRRSPAGFGTQSDRLPFEALATSKRVSALRVMQVDVARAHKKGDEQEARRLTHISYHELRKTWERAVEEVLFQGVVNRFELGVATQKLKGVEVDDDDYRVIDAGMTKSSTFEHDQGSDAELPVPLPDELSEDIEALEIWRKSVVARAIVVVKARK